MAAGGEPEPEIPRAKIEAALQAAAAAAAGCGAPDGPRGHGRIAVTLSPSGRATRAIVESGLFAGTPVGSCVARHFSSVSVPGYAGDFLTVRRSFQVR